MQHDLERTIAEPVPLQLRNAVTGLMRHIGYGEGYQYAHNNEDKVTDMQCLPESLAGRIYYRPTREGLEAKIQERLLQLRKLQKRPTASNPADDSQTRAGGKDASENQSSSEIHGTKDQRP